MNTAVAHGTWDRLRLLGLALVLLAASLPVGISLFALTVVGLPLIGLMGSASR